MSFLDLIDREKFLKGVTYGLLVEFSLIIILLLVWLITIGNFRTFPIAYFTFGIGGFLLVVAGCIGPGRYTRDYKILLYTPDSGTSFSNEIKVSGFVMDPEIKVANIIVNGQPAGEIKFTKFTRAEATISRKDFISSTINTIFLQSGDIKSNTSDFTLFEYTEDMDDEEVEELHEMETREPDKTLEQAELDYKERMNTRVGSISVGLLTLAFANFFFVFILGTLFNINF